MDINYADSLWLQIENVLALGGTATFRVHVPPQQLAEVRALITEERLRRVFPVPELRILDIGIDYGALYFRVKYGLNRWFTAANVDALEELLQPVYQPGLPRVAIVSIDVGDFVADEDWPDMGLHHRLSVTRPGMDYTFSAFHRDGASYTMTFDPPEITFYNIPGRGQWVQRYDGPAIGAEFYRDHPYNLWGELGNEEHEHWLRVDDPHVQRTFIVAAYDDEHGVFANDEDTSEAEGFPMLRARATEAAAEFEKPTVTFSDLVWLPVTDTSSYGHAVVPPGVTVVPSQADVTADGTRRDCDPGHDGISFEEFEPGDHIINRNGTTACYKAENVKRAMEHGLSDPTTRQPWGVGWE